MIHTLRSHGEFKMLNVKQNIKFKYGGMSILIGSRVSYTSGMTNKLPFLIESSFYHSYFFLFYLLLFFLIRL